MSSHVHFLPVSFGSEHYVRPLMRSAHPVDKAVLLVPKSDPQRRVTDGAATRLETDVGIEVEKRAVPTDDFATVVATAYDDLEEELAKSSHVYINTASSPWALGSGYATAASYLIAESMYETDVAGERYRDRITLYYTEPEEYRVDELLEVAQTSADLRTEFRDIRAAAGGLREDVETDKATVESIVSMLDAQDGSTASLDIVLDQLELLTQGADDQTIDEALREIIDGIESVTAGINMLARPENQATLAAIREFSGPGGFGNILFGIEELGARPDSDDSEVTPDELFEYFAERLGEVHEVLERVERRADIEEEFEKPPDELKRFLSETETRGVARGVQSFDGHSYVELPGPLDFDLRSYQQAILYTLAAEEEVDSIKRLTLRVTQHTLASSELFADEIPSHPEVEAVRSGTADPDDSFVTEYIRSRIQTSIQKNLDDLEAAGFIEKSTGGRTTSVVLTRAGSVYTDVQSFDDEWRRAVFAELYGKINAHAEAFVEAERG